MRPSIYFFLFLFFFFFKNCRCQKRPLSCQVAALPATPKMPVIQRRPFCMWWAFFFIFTYWHSDARDESQNTKIVPSPRRWWEWVRRFVVVETCSPLSGSHHVEQGKLEPDSCTRLLHQKSLRFSSRAEKQDREMEEQI